MGGGSPWEDLHGFAPGSLADAHLRVDADKGFQLLQPPRAPLSARKRTTSRSQFTCRSFRYLSLSNTSMDQEFLELFCRRRPPPSWGSPDGLKKVDRFLVHFFGVKTESPSQQYPGRASQVTAARKSSILYRE
ncbi:hypothetical protein GWK47_053250 [Chionoecetes opilio]|uniref:Uncharacterized protein n=1 Tax=Chionoecetes opilio TaxID=41210 RepID=A0A8J4Y6A5_CHIOP|nr:hypothetical protein GWK47_053250 [Chionoecetes opilio]